MTSREEIALHLTLENIPNIVRNTAASSTGNDNEILSKEIAKFYNYIYNNVSTHNDEKVTVLK